MKAPILEIKDLKTQFFSDEGIVRAVDGVSLSLGEGETLGLVGESACGKSTIALSIMRLVDPRQGRIAGGEILWRGRDLLALGERQMREIRGNEIAMIFQDPFASLNPVFPVGGQIAEAVRLHQGLGRRRAMGVAREALAQVRIPSPEVRVNEYPHQMSGGMQQRVMIAMALSCNPKLLIADEPTTALDVTIQAQILDMLKEIQERREMSLMLISHDLGVISEMADRMAIMYAGQIVEEGATADILRLPRHPYTRALLRSIPRLGARRTQLEAIGGGVPNPVAYPPGCRFHPRCSMARTECRKAMCELRGVGEGRRSSCIFSEDVSM
ncbi:MAG: ABC transporter ATP-binding protein [Candidatus Aureabacteria bacterium]|nr:ABC transporter ATP-binding protein [Candidatus Auribacterota bacterium]